MENCEIKGVDEIFQEVIKKYEKNPKGWHVFFNLERTYPTLLISGPEETWIVKFESCFKPQPLGKGIKIDSKIKVPFKQPTYGFRPLSSEDIEKLLHARKSQEKLKTILDSLLRKSPSPLRKIRAPGILGGPITYSNLSWISDEQRKLERKLAKELEKHIYRKYGIYI